MARNGEPAHLEKLKRNRISWFLCLCVAAFFFTWSPSVSASEDREIAPAKVQWTDYRLDFSAAGESGRVLADNPTEAAAGWMPFTGFDRFPETGGAIPPAKISLWLKARVPELPARSPYLWINETAAIVKVEVYLEGRRIFVSNENKLPVGLHQWDFVPLKPEDAGKTLEIRLSPAVSHEFAVWTGTQIDLTVMMILRDAPVLFLGIVLFCLGIASAVMFARLRSEKIYAFFAVFTVSASIRFCLWGGSWQLFVPADSLRQIGYFASMDWYVYYAGYLFLYAAVFGSGHRRVLHGCAWGYLLFGAAHFAARVIAGPSVDDFFYYHFFYYLAPVVMITVFVITALLLGKRRELEVVLMVTGFMAIMVTEAYVFAARILLPFHVGQTSPQLYAWLAVDWNNYGTLVFVACVGAILVKRLAEVNRTVKDYAGQLEEKNERLQQMDRLKDEFLANTSHELRTPLHGIIGLTESLLEGAAGRLKEPAAANLAMVLASAKRLANLINDILDFSKLKHHDIRVRTIPVDICKQTDIVLALSSPFVRGKRLSLVNAIPPNTYVLGDPDRIQQILQNLIGNAVKFTECGIVEIAAGDPVRSDRQLEIVVSDTGIGIPADKLESIFESFEQADGSTVREYGGTGLGLAITKQLVELQGGTIRAESELGKGSRFLLTLPLATEAPEEPTEEKYVSRLSDEDIVPAMSGTYRLPAPDPEYTAEAAVSHEDGNTPVILIVDDDPVNLQVLSNYLLHKFAVRQTGSGMEALDMIEQGFKPDMVILDVMMPRMSGYEACMRLREIYSASELPVILLTGKNRVQDLVEGFGAGANDYVMKPVAKDELLSRINLHLRVFKWHKALERQVSERTHELAETNLRLDRVNRELEQAYHELSAMEQSRRMLFTNISHELGTPLTSIIGYVKGMLDGIEKLQDRKYIQRIYDKSLYLHRIIKDLFELSKLEAQQLDFEFQQVDLLAFLQELYLHYDIEVSMKGIRFEIAVPERLSGTTVMAEIDRIRVEQVVSNFIANAVKFTMPGGTIRLSVQLEAISKAEGKGTISLRDTGIGIDEEDLPHVFDRFYRGRRSRQSRTEGTGLGLAICKEIIRQHRGEIGAVSRPGEGSKFYFTLPVKFVHPEGKEIG